MTLVTNLGRKSMGVTAHPRVERGRRGPLTGEHGGCGAIAHPPPPRGSGTPRGGGREEVGDVWPHWRALLLPPSHPLLPRAPPTASFSVRPLAPRPSGRLCLRPVVCVLCAPGSSTGPLLSPTSSSMACGPNGQRLGFPEGSLGPTPRRPTLGLFKLVDGMGWDPRPTQNSCPLNLGK